MQTHQPSPSIESDIVGAATLDRARTLVVLALIGCSPAGAPAPVPPAPICTATLSRTVALEPGNACELGGVLIQSGADVDCDDELSDAEVTSESRRCDRLSAPCAVGPGSIALNFDDSFIEDWYATRDLLDRYDARATFYVTRPHRLDERTGAMVRELAADGHEIGCHGLTHIDPDIYAEQHGAPAYITDEILPALEAFAGLGLRPTTFAYPRNGRTPVLDVLLLQQFRLLRGSGRIPRLPRLLTDPGPPRVVNGMGIDTLAATTPEILGALEAIAASGRTGILYGHRTSEGPMPGHHHIPRSELQRVLARACALGLSFRRMDELVEPAPPPGLEVIYGWLDEGDIETADRILDDEWAIPRFDPVKLAWPYTWSEDPYGEKYWQFLFYSLRETRHLLFAFRTTGEVRYLDKLSAILTHFDQASAGSPFVSDKHGTAFRAMVAVNTYFKLRTWGSLEPGLASALTGIIRRDAEFLADPRNHEGSYNHGVTQAAALLLIAENFAGWDQAPGWGALARERLTGLLAGTVDADGAQVEQSPYYHFYVLRMFWQIDDWVQRAGIDPVPGLHDTVLAMIRFGTYMLQPDARIPLLGSSTDLDLASSFRDLRAGAAALDEGFAFVTSRGKEGVAPAPASMLFPVAGFSVLRSGFGDASDAAEQAHVVLDVGPYRTGHSQLDALSLHLYAAGRPLLVDAGLYTYEKGPERDHYRSTRAHNTVTVDGRDQAEGSGRPGALRTGDGWSWQSGAHELYAGVEHRRGVLLVGRELLVVVDHVSSAEEHDLEQNWHLPTGAVVETDGLGARVLGENGETVLAAAQALPDNLSLDVIEGAISPRQGWYSASYETERPAPVLTYRRAGREAWFVTAFTMGARASQPLGVDAVVRDDGVDVVVVQPAAEHLLSVGDLAGPAELVRVAPVQASAATALRWERFRRSSSDFSTTPRERTPWM